MGSAMAAALTAPDPTAAITAADLQKIMKGIAAAIVTEITSNGQVAMGIPVSTTGGPAAQTGSTTAPGKIT
jgi:uncharacterized ferredoxin-like protein